MTRHSLYLIALMILAGLTSTATSSTAAPADDAWTTFNNTASRFLPAKLCGQLAEAFYDTETGLLWDRTPNGKLLDFSVAELYCNQRIRCGRRGFRLPTLQELTSLGGQLAPNQPFNFPQKPNPFSAPTEARQFWSATQVVAAPGDFWGVDSLGDPIVLTPNSNAIAWCVRFRQGVDEQ